MPTYKLLLEYEGTRYSGWQAQTNTPKTVQGRLLSAARDLFGEVDLSGAGRTDAGVHAAGQVAHLRLQKRAAPAEIVRMLNEALPHDINILGATPANDRFHARHDAISRVYLYQISRRRTAFAKPFVWWIRDSLDVARMADAAALIPGRHDFASFTDRRNKAESTLVIVESAAIAEWGDLILVRIAASHFLWKMVRKLVHALTDAGRGTLTKGELAAHFEPEAAKFGPTAPPSGLFLEAVLYPGDAFDRPLEPIVEVHRRKP
ncbi:MAG TPA: tRNA pseudouridine(38-40) synthase TruA [Thermoanaerobaculia bacterium]|nr:tRNA pseudouridine(38-40) synthase TruA [Thermoanaerobaculia bacterium]